jgi:carbamoyl-phosphate synthase large subunit
MPKRPDIKKVLLIGSGPIQIGQAAEFDFSGSQACRSLREEGIQVVLVNSNPATIMTDPEMADAVYVEPITPQVVAQIIEKERPDGIIAGLGGQTGLNITSELAEMGVLEKYGVKLLGTPLKAIYDTEDRDRFKHAMEAIGEKVPRSFACSTIEEAVAVIEKLGLPLIIRSAFTLGGTGSGIARTEENVRQIAEIGLKRSRIHQILVEESILGWKEFEYEVMRDASDTCITICNMENIDPMGIHTGESIVVTPSQTLSDVDHQTLRSAAIKIIRALGIEGGCNIQFAWKEGEYRIVEVNPRVSRSSALASKATGYPIARIAAKIAIGMHLHEIPNKVTMETPASFEPTIDYVVVKIPRWPFDKFKSADKHITTSMKSTGEVMAIGRTYEEALQKALNSLDISEFWGYGSWSKDEMAELLRNPTHERMFVIYKALKTGAFTVDEICELSNIDPWFVVKIKNIVGMGEKLKTCTIDKENLRKAKRMGFTDEWIAELRGVTPEEIGDERRALGVIPTYKMVDTCAAEFAARTPYYYSTYEDECELQPSNRKKVLIIGAGPIRIGQGIEFDYCTVHAVQALRESGIEAHIINNNPETVSTDFDTSDKLFFEPITLEHVMNVIEKERPYGVMVQFGGQTSVNMAIPLQMELTRRKDLDTVIIGTSPDDMNIAEDRDLWSRMMKEMNITQPDSGIAYSQEEAKVVAARIGYPILVRPSYVLGGRAMEVVYDETDLARYMTEAVKVSRKHPVLIDDFLENAVEIDVDAVSDGKDVLIGAIMEHIEEAGIHSGDSACVIPPQSLSPAIQEEVRNIVRKIALRLHVIGCVNLQMAYKSRNVYVLEANPRSSRTIPFVSKATGVPLAKIAAKVIIGCSLKEMGCTEEPMPKHVSVKEVVLPFDKLPGADPILGPEMKSTGEVMGIDVDFGRAYFKAELSAFNSLPQEGTVFISVRDEDKPEIVRIARILRDNGLEIIGTEGTKTFLEGHGIPVRLMSKIYEGSPNVTDLMREGKVHLIINTPTSKMGRKDGATIRRAAVDYEVPYVTTIQAARASADAINAMGKRKVSIRSLNEYLALDKKPVALLIEKPSQQDDKGFV